MGDSKKVVLYTDGSCLGNPGSGGWCVNIEVPARQPIVLVGGAQKTTNNRMELIGAIEGLREVKRLIADGELPEGVEVHLYSDSKYLIDGLTRWLPGWERKGFKGVKNRELWEELAQLHRELRPQLHWVPGHSGVTENEKCDQGAKVMAHFYQQWPERERGDESLKGVR